MDIIMYLEVLRILGDVRPTGRLGWHGAFGVTEWARKRCCLWRWVSQTGVIEKPRTTHTDYLVAGTLLISAQTPATDPRRRLVLQRRFSNVTSFTTLLLLLASSFASTVSSTSFSSLFLLPQLYFFTYLFLPFFFPIFPSFTI